MISRRHWLFIIMTISIWLFSCMSPSQKHPAEEFFGSKIDTSNLLPLPTSTSAHYRKNLVQVDWLKADGSKRPKGIASVPQDFDDFRFDNLDESQWQRISVKQADFRGSSFRSANGNGSVFTGSDFRLCDLRWTFLNNSILNECNFAQSILFRTSVNDSKLDSSDFQGSNMFGIKGHRSSFTYCDFSNALMKEAELTEANFSFSKALKVNFIITVFSGSKFDHCDFSFSDFTGAGLEDCSFKNARLHACSFKGAHLQYANFAGADLKNADFFAAEMAETNFSGAINIPDHLASFINDEGYATGIILTRN